MVVELESVTREAMTPDPKHLTDKLIACEQGYWVADYGARG